MTWKEFESELIKIPGVYTIHETDDLGEFLIVHIGNVKIDYFLISHLSNPDVYMTYHYLLLVRILAARM